MTPDPQGAHDPYTIAAEGFVRHTVKWALVLPVALRREIMAAARAQAERVRQSAAADRPAFFASPALWEEIAHRIETEGHTPPL